jgi:acetyl esterase
MTHFEIDSDVQQFIDTMNQVSCNLSTDTSIEQQRANSNAACRYFFAPYPAGVESSDDIVTGRHGPIHIRRYRNTLADIVPDTQIIFLHGGGFVLGDIESHDDICAELCGKTGLDAISIDYRLAPEYKHPVHLDDVADAFDICWKSKSIVVGISAGATLAASLSHRLKNASRKPFGQVLIYPGLGGDLFDLDSYLKNATAPLLTTADIFYYRKMRCDNFEMAIRDPEFYPLVADDFNGLPPTIAFSADIDPLRDDARLYIEKLSIVGVYAEWHNEPGLTHDYLRARHICDKARDSFQHICQSITLLCIWDSLIKPG